MRKDELVLASASPRRRELLEQLGVAHEVKPVHLDETPRSGEAPREYVQRLALEKARAGAAREAHTDVPVLGADTVVVVGDEVLGKPADRAAALAMLARLSDRTHTVFSAVALVAGARCRQVLSETRVGFRAIAPAEAAAYWETGEPADKAGGYAIQGLGAVFVARIEGSYSGVMGLPLFETARLLEEAGIRILRGRP